MEGVAEGTGLGLAVMLGVGVKLRVGLAVREVVGDAVAAGRFPLSLPQAASANIPTTRADRADTFIPTSIELSGCGCVAR